MGELQQKVIDKYVERYGKIEDGIRRHFENITDEQARYVLMHIEQPHTT